MRTFATLLAGSAAGLLLAAGAAQAGVCSGEIMALQKQMEETPTKASSTAPGTVPQTAGQTLGEAEATPGTKEMPDASGGTLVQNDAAPQPAPTEPMDSDAAAASQLNTAAGTDTTGTGATGTDAAAQALARARALDQAGDEAACMDAIEEAKGQLGQSRSSRRARSSSWPRPFHPRPHPALPSLRAAPRARASAPPAPAGQDRDAGRGRTRAR
jgi:hypothetical protein